MLKKGLRIIVAVQIFFVAVAFAATKDAALPKNDSPQQFFACESKVLSVPSIKFDELTGANVATALGWVRDKKIQDFCGGYYIEPEIVLATPHPLPIKEAPVSVSAKRPSFFSQYGTSILQGDVTITQPGREVTADRVTLVRDAKTGQLSSSVLLGHVNLREYGKIIVAQSGSLNFANKIYRLENAVYRMLTPYADGFISAWGRAKEVLSDKPGVLKLTKATYTTCPPDNTTWYVKSNYLVLDKNIGRGSATNTFIYVKNMPVFYTPYFSFPIDKTRKSGFLYPSFNYSKNSGLLVTLPYYFNLAPNYDFTFTPEAISKRGVMANGLFRYLTPQNSGNLSFAFIPHDRVFSQFQESAPLGNPPSHSLTDLENATDARGFVSFQDKTIFNDHWSSSLDVNRISDDYYLQDFGSIPEVINNDQLLSQADLNYASEHWRFLGRVQDFQTLHPLGLVQVPDQYRRLPQLDLIADYPSRGNGLAYKFESEFVNFQHRRDYYTDIPVVQGGRLNVMPGISLPWSNGGIYLTPQAQFAVTNYTLRDQTSNVGASVTRLLPLLSVDSGMFFNRDINLFHATYTQTLEPRLFYLFVPYENQNKIQIFDTTLPALDYNQMFRVNRFSGYDRIGDANQVTLALTSRLLDNYGQEKINLGIGQIFLLQKHRVCINNDCSSDPLSHEWISPVVGKLQYNVTSQWNATANIAWDPSYHQLDTGVLNLQYLKDQTHIANVWYNFVRNGDSTTPQTGIYNLNRFGVSLSWSIWHNWNILGDWDYNIAASHSQNYFYGIEYETCCWAIRVVQSQVFANVNSNGKNTYNSTLYLQILLKGLGNFGLSDAGGLLTSQIPNYRDKFASGFRL